MTVEDPRPPGDAATSRRSPAPETAPDERGRHRRAGGRRRLGRVARAALWYPLVCLLAAAAFAAWVWRGCASAKAVAECRSDVAPETLWALGLVLLGGICLLGVVGVAARLATAAMARASEREAPRG
jgi:hypothetical protein